jgi:hypothetical protein
MTTRRKRKLKRKLKPHEAEQQAKEEHWQCATCRTPALEAEIYCLSCKLYWEDCCHE